MLPTSWTDQQVEEDFSVGQKTFAILRWCLHNEMSAGLSERLLKHLDKEARKQLPDFDLRKALKTPDYEVFDIVRQIEARLIHEVLGDLFQCVEGLTGTGGIYLLLTRHELSVGMYARTQGDALFISVYDPEAVKGTRGPGFFGFDKVEDAGAFVSELFQRPNGAGGPVSNRFSATILKSKHAYLETEEQRGKAWEREVADTNQDASGVQELDPKHEARVVYSAMYDAAKKPLAEDRVFSWAPQAGMHVQTYKEVERERGEEHHAPDI